jgi:hypothetical protein
MKNILPATIALLIALNAFAAEKKSAPAKPGLTPAQSEARYTAVIDERSQKIVAALGLGDTNAAAKVHDIIMAQYRALNDWHNANDARIKAAKGDQAAIAEIQAPLRKLHAEYLARLAEHLTPDQIEIVKDKMTYGKVQFTFKGYGVEYPDMSKVDQQAVLNYLKQAREEAMDAGSANEKSAIFNRYKGKINNYLAKQGIHSHKAKADSHSHSSAK